MQAEMERTFRNLKVISALKQNDKLTTECSIFELHPPTMTRSFVRFYMNESREHNLDKIQNVIRDATAFVEKYSSTNESSETFHGRLYLLTQAGICKRIMVALEESVQGLHNLAFTYRDDAGAKAKIEMIIDEIRDFRINTQVITNTNMCTQSIENSQLL